MNIMTARLEKRGAVNVEYILLIVVGALSVVLGLTALGSAMNTKHTQIATALVDKSVAGIGTFAPYQPGDTNPSVFGAITVGYVNQPETGDIMDGVIRVAAANPNGVAPFSLYKDGVQVATGDTPEFTFDDGLAICYGNGADTTAISNYTVRDSSGVTSAVATDEFRCISCHGADYATNGHAPETALSPSVFGDVSIGFVSGHVAGSADGMIRISSTNAHGATPFALFRDGVPVATSATPDFTIDDGEGCADSGVATNATMPHTFVVKDANGISSASVTNQFRYADTCGADCHS